MTLLDENIKILGRNTRHQIAPISAEDLIYDYLGEVKEGQIFIDKSEKAYLVKAEIDRENLPNVTKPELFFVLGIQSISELKSILKSANRRSFFVIVEPELSFFLHTLQTQDLGFLDKENIMIAAQPLHTFSTTLEQLFSREQLLLSGNIRFYGTYFYRQYDLQSFKILISMVTASLSHKMFGIGDSMQDSLIGLAHNLQNIPFLERSKDVRCLKKAFEGKPAIVVSAGPSLDKNIHHLRKAKGKAIILAVDTIVDKLLAQDIKPDFIFSVERIDDVYECFYKNKVFPKDITLVAPPVLKPEIFAEFRGQIIIPMRDKVPEYRWLDTILEFGNDAFLSMGSSVAHLAFGFADHLGASPIILVGQDLAYADHNGRTHSLGTVYGNHVVDLNRNPGVEIEGYNNDNVLTQKLWITFKHWFEIEILNKKLFVINATEGGARIKNTTQMPLSDAIEQYCVNTINIAAVLDSCPVNRLDKDKIKGNLAKAVNEIHAIVRYSEHLKEVLDNLKIRSDMTQYQLEEALGKMRQTDQLLSAIYANKLLFHNLQPTLVNTFQNLYRIPEILSYDTVEANRSIQYQFCKVVHHISNLLLHVVDGALRDDIRIEEI